MTRNTQNIGGSRKRLRIWLASLILVFLLPVITVSTANAARPNMGMGTVALVHSDIVSGPTHHGQTTIVVFKNTFHVTGALSGSAVAIERDVMHNVTVAGKTITITTFHGLANFTGTLDDKSGTLRIRYEGINNSTFIRGHFTVFHGTAQLVGVHGGGPFHGAVSMTVPLDYTIHWTVHTHGVHTHGVHTHGVHPETRDEDEHED